jgi:hypothetical protein
MGLEIPATARLYDDRVVTDAQSIDRIKNLSNIHVHFRKGVWKVSKPSSQRI